MTRASFRSRAGALLFLLGLFATPLHLALEEHEWFHEGSGDEHPHDANGEDHPAVDHELIALSRTVKPLPVAIEAPIVAFSVAEPQFKTWIPSLETESIGPPEDPHAPPRSPRAPPL